MAILVMGLGNLLMSDDGLGSRVISELETRFAPRAGVILLDGGTLGLDLLPRLEGIDRLLIIDALQMGAEPGAVFRLEGEEVPRAFANKLSVHQMGLQDLLAVAELQGHLPAELVVIGAQSALIEMRMELSAQVSAAFDEVIRQVLVQLETWGEPLNSV
jgi:hydrogenase maturation protease